MSKNKWQPMSTAPMNGSEVLVVGQYNDRHVAYYAEGRWRGSTGNGCESWFGTPTKWQHLPPID